MLKMVTALEKALERDIRELPWMTEATKKRALEKLHAIRNKIGFPDKWRDYSTLEIVRGDAMGNAIRANLFETRRDLAKIGKPVDRAGDGFTPEQRIFLGWAQVWCQNVRPEEARRRVITDPHSPGRYRVIGVVSNTPEFRQAFGCKTGQPMAPEKACRVW